MKIRNFGKQALYELCEVLGRDSTMETLAKDLPLPTFIYETIRKYIEEATAREAYIRSLLGKIHALEETLQEYEEKLKLRL